MLQRHVRTDATYRVFLVTTVVAIGVLTLTPARGAVIAPPFWCISCGESVGHDAVRNVLLFVPFGASLALLELGVLPATVAGMVLSTVIELMQFAIPGREPAVRDILTNTIGAAVGAAMISFMLARGRPQR